MASIFSLGVGELICRWWLLTEPVGHIVEAPYLPARTKPDFVGEVWDIPVHTNEWGFRDEGPVGEPVADELRILSLGDSIGFGVGIKAEEHYSQVLERELGAARALNAGGMGYSPSGYAAYYLNEGRRVKAGLVLVEIELCNDLTDEALLQWGASEEHGAPLAVRGGRYVVAWDGNFLGSYTRGPYFYEKTYLWSVVTRGALNAWESFRPNPLFQRDGIGYYFVGYDRALLSERRIEQGWERLFGALAGLGRAAEGDGARLLVLLLPSRYVFDSEAPAYQKFAVDLVERAALRMQADGVEFLDARAAIGEAGGSGLYLDFAHLTAKGNRVVGEATAAVIAEGLSPGARARPAAR